MRLFLVAAVLSISALTGFVRADPPAFHVGDAAPAQIASQPAPESDPPAIVRAALTTAVNVNAPLRFESGGVHRGVTGAVAACSRLAIDPARAVRPRSFPLLI